MKFAIHDYLAHLRERDELDAILPDLLRAMGFEIVKLAFRGEVEHGVDIAAFGQEKGEPILYLIQVKPGDIDATNWDCGPNSIRPTLNNLLDVPFQDLTRPKLQQARRKVLLVHNGVLRENIRDRFNGYLKGNFNMGFERWDLDRLAGLFTEHLFNERILPVPYRTLLKRTLVFLDVPDYDLSDFRELMQSILPDAKPLSKDGRTRVFGFVRLILAMIRADCQRESVNSLTPAITAHEQALLALWGWMRRNNFFSKLILEEFVRTYLIYVKLLVEWAEVIAPAANAPDGLAHGGTYERVEYPMRTFGVIANLGLLAMALIFVPDSANKQRQLGRTIGLLANAIRNNRSCHRPLLDNQSIDIFLGMWPLLLTGHTEFVKSWLADILEHLAIRKRVLGRLPETYNNIDAVVEYEATGERPIGYTDSSSTLIYILFELTLLLGAEDLYAGYRAAFEGVSLQIWYPPESVEDILFSREVSEGDTEIIHGLPESFEEFRLDVQARHRFDRLDYSPLKFGLPTMLLLASKHFRTPVFSFWWRVPLFTERSEDGTSPLGG